MSVENNDFKDFTSLRCWQQCRDVKMFFYRKVLHLIPHDENFNLKFQIRKSARSITANIAEGAGRYFYKEAIQFLRISRGSLNELKDDLISCRDLEFIDQNLYETGIELIDQARKSINGFIKYNEKKAKDSSK